MWQSPGQLSEIGPIPAAKQRHSPNLRKSVLTALSTAKLACPIDGLPLKASDRSLICSQGHSFDIAAAGYANLLPVQLKASRDPGDSKAMVQARRRLLDDGVFKPLADALADLVLQCLASAAEPDGCVVDAGCGEGFYTDHLRQQIRSSRPNNEIQVVGVDISKWAIQSAAKRYRDVAWIVGTNKQLPIEQDCASVITSLFGFEMWESWFALQRSGQFVITVDSGTAHLVELRELVYDDVRFHDAPTNTSAIEAGYRMTEEMKVNYKSTISTPSLLRDLLEMTPHVHRSKTRDFDDDAVKFPAQMTVDVVVRAFMKP